VNEIQMIRFIWFWFSYVIDDRLLYLCFSYVVDDLTPLYLCCRSMTCLIVK
jgi:hypothetical protein